MQEKLQLVFLDAQGKTKSLTIQDPKKNLDAETLKAAATEIINSGAILTSDGNAIKQLKSADIIAQTVTELV